MEGLLFQSTQVTVTVLMIDSSDHITGKTGLAAGITKYLTKAGTGTASATMTTTELDSTNAKGLYAVTFTTSHTDTLGELQLHLTATGADPADYKWQVVAFNPDDGVHLGITALPNAAAAASGGLLISGSNTGTVTISDGLIINRSTGNSSALVLQGNGSGDGINSTGGSTGNGGNFRGGSASGDGILADGAVDGRGIHCIGGNSFGAGFRSEGLTTNANGFETVGTGTGHGLSATSGSGATGDGIKAVANSTNGNGIEAVHTGTGKDIKGVLQECSLVDTLTTYTGNTPQTGDVFANLPTNFSAMVISSGGLVTTSYNIRKNTALANFMFVMVNSSGVPTPGLTVTGTRSLDGAAFASCANSVSEIGAGVYKINLAATDLNASNIMLRFAAVGAADSDISIITQ